MEIRQLILKELRDLLNTNAQGIQFRIDDPSGIYNSNFTNVRFGDPEENENWYDLISEQVVPVVVNSFDASFVPQPDVRAFSGGAQLSFLVDFEKQQDIIAAIEDFVNKLPGLTLDLFKDPIEDEDPVFTGYNITFNGSFPVFVNTEIFDDMRYNLYRLNISILGLLESFSANNMEVYLSNEGLGTGYVKIPFINYTPNRTRESTVVQQIGTNSVVSVAKNSVWLGTVSFFLSTNDTGNVSLQDLTRKILQILENSSLNQNDLFKLKVVYKTPVDYTVEKDVIITGIQSNFIRDDLASVTLQLEEAYIDIISPPSEGDDNA